MVVEDPEILSGTPVIKGTRVPVHDVAASFEAGISIERILSAYPSLKEGQVELAAVYARAFPAPKRPKESFVDLEHVKVLKRVDCPCTHRAICPARLPHSDLPRLRR